MVFSPSIALPRPWTNDRLTLYHGTVQLYVPSVLNGISLAYAGTRSDFGRGFYTTTIEQQARAWAWQLSQRRAGTVPAVVRLDLDRDELAALECLWFVRGGADADDFWSLVYHCRSGGGSHLRPTSGGWYDVVAGPISLNWRRRRTLPDGDQVSFHTDRAVALLNASSPRITPW